MHVQIDRVTVRITEKTLHEIFEAIRETKKARPYKRNILVKSEYCPMRFLVDFDDGSQNSYHYKASEPKDDIFKKEKVWLTK